MCLLRFITTIMYVFAAPVHAVILVYSHLSATPLPHAFTPPQTPTATTQQAHLVCVEVGSLPDHALDAAGSSDHLVDRDLRRVCGEKYNTWFGFEAE